MRSASVAEWIIGRSTNKSHAASIIGDLVELKSKKGNLWFWLSLVRVVLSLTWRRPIAFVAAILGFFVWISLQMSVVTPIWRSHAYKHPEHSWMLASQVLFVVGATLLMVFMYSAIRYGFRDGFTRLAIVLTPIVAAATAYCWSQSAILAVFILVGILFAAAYMANEKPLRGVVAFTIVIAAGLAGFMLASRLSSLSMRHLGYGRHVPPSAVWILLSASLCEILLTTLLMTIACSWTHGWLMKAQRLESDIGSAR